MKRPKIEPIVLTLAHTFADDYPIMKPEPKGSAMYKPKRSKRIKSKRRK